MSMACPYCSAESVPHIAAPDLNRRVSDEVFEVRRCTGCGLFFVANPPPDLGRYYTGDYHGLPPDRASLLAVARAHEQYRIDTLTAFVTGGTLLEIGPSSGVFCVLAQEAGFAVHAIEMDEDCTRFLNETIGVQAVHSADPAAVLAADPRRYDAICLWHAIEHMPEPWRVLKAARDRLAPSGVMLVAAPNPLSIQARWMGANWPHHDLPRHLFGLSIPWLTTWAGKAGLRVEMVTTRDAGSLYWNRFSWAKRLSRCSSNSRLNDWLWRAGIRIGFLLDPIEGREGVGACYVAILRAPPAD